MIALQNKKIAIVDDDLDLARQISWEIEETGYEFEIIQGHFTKINQLILSIKKNCQFAICDHRLSNAGFANFPGSELVANLYDHKIPAILVTQYIDMDVDVSIREYRDKIPILLSRDNVDSSSLKKGIEECRLELDGRISRTRKAYRTLVRVDQILNESGKQVVDAFIPSWNPSRAVRFPASLIPDEIRFDALKPDARLIARVNIGASEPDDLYFKEFELATKPSEDDGLCLN